MRKTGENNRKWDSIGKIIEIGCHKHELNEENQIWSVYFARRFRFAGSNWKLCVFVNVVAVVVVGAFVFPDFIHCKHVPVMCAIWQREPPYAFWWCGIAAWSATRRMSSTRTASVTAVVMSSSRQVPNYFLLTIHSFVPSVVSGFIFSGKKSNAMQKKLLY